MEQAGELRVLLSSLLGPFNRDLNVVLTLSQVDSALELGAESAFDSALQLVKVVT